MATNEQASPSPNPTQAEQADSALADALIARTQWLQRALSPWTRRWLPAASQPDRVGQTNPGRVGLTTSHTTSFLNRIQRTVEVAGFWRIDAETLNPVRYDRFGGAIVDRFPDTSHRYEAQPTAVNAGTPDLVLAGTGESTAVESIAEPAVPAQPGNFQAFSSFADFKAALEAGQREAGAAPASPPTQPAILAQTQASSPVQRTTLPPSPPTSPPQPQRASQPAQLPPDWPRRPRPRARIEEITPAAETEPKAELVPEPTYQTESLPAPSEQAEADLDEPAEMPSLQRRPKADVTPPVKPAQPSQPATRPTQAARLTPPTEAGRRSVQRTESELAPVEPEQPASLENQDRPAQAGQAEMPGLLQADAPEQPLIPVRKPADLPVQRSMEQGAASPPVERGRPTHPSSQVTEPAIQRAVEPEVSLPESEQSQPPLRPAEPGRPTAAPDSEVKPPAQRSTVEALPLRELPSTEKTQPEQIDTSESPPAKPGQASHLPVQRSTVEEKSLPELPPVRPEQTTPPESSQSLAPVQPSPVEALPLRELLSTEQQQTPPPEPGQTVEPAVQRRVEPKLPLTQKLLVEKGLEIPTRSPALPEPEQERAIEPAAEQSTLEEMPLRDLPFSEKTQPTSPAEQADKPEPGRVPEPPVQRSEQPGVLLPPAQEGHRQPLARRANTPEQPTQLPPSEPVEPASQRSVEPELLPPDLPLVESKQPKFSPEVLEQPQDSPPGPVVEPPVQRSTAEEMPLRELSPTEPEQSSLLSRTELQKASPPEPGQGIEPPVQRLTAQEMPLRELSPTEPEQSPLPVSRVEPPRESPPEPGPVVEPPVQRSIVQEMPLRELSPPEKIQPGSPLERAAGAPETSQSTKPSLQQSVEPEPVELPPQRSMQMPLRELPPVERDRPSPPVGPVTAPEWPPLSQAPASQVAAPELPEVPSLIVRGPEPVVQRTPQSEIEMPLRPQPPVRHGPDEAAPTGKIEEASGLDTAILARATTSARMPLFDAGRELGRVAQGNPVQTRLLPQMAALPQARVQAHPAEADEVSGWPDEPPQPVSFPLRPAVATAESTPLPLAIPVRVEVKQATPVGTPLAPSAPATSPVQRQVVVEEKPTPAVETAPAPLPDGGSIQRVENEGTQQSIVEPGAGVELDKLARQIYPLIKRMLAVERERRPVR